jgi:hypothetical protein
MNELETLVGEHAVEAAAKFSKWEWEQLQKCLTCMLQELSKYNPDKFIPGIIGKAGSFNFLQNKEDTWPTYWYKSVKEMFQKHSIIYSTSKAHRKINKLCVLCQFTNQGKRDIIYM